MSAAFVQRRVSRSVASRLAAGLLPSLLAVGLVIGLFYYGENGRGAPRLILAGAAALAAISIVAAWANANYFADRLSRLANATDTASKTHGGADEFDRIERAVGTLGSALSAAEEERARTNAAAAARLREQATMLAAVVGDARSQLDQVRLPLQILLESPFGELNDNQEELLRDARAASDSIDVALRRLGQVADIDRESLPVQQELVQVNDVVRSVQPLARAVAERRGARTESALEPGLPRVPADRVRLAEALALFTTDAAAVATADVPFAIGTARDGGGAVIRITPISATARQLADGLDRSETAASPTIETTAELASLLFASRLISAQGGELSVVDSALTIRIGAHLRRPAPSTGPASLVEPFTP